MKLVYALDKIQQYESAVKVVNSDLDCNPVAISSSTAISGAAPHRIQRNSTVKSAKRKHKHNEIITEPEQDCEVYDLSV